MQTNKMKLGIFYIQKFSFFCLLTPKSFYSSSDLNVSQGPFKGGEDDVWGQKKSHNFFHSIFVHSYNYEAS